MNKTRRLRLDRQPVVLLVMKLFLTRQLIPKDTDADGRESAIVDIEPTDLMRTVRVTSFNDRFFEVLVTDIDASDEFARLSMDVVMDELDEEDES